MINVFLKRVPVFIVFLIIACLLYYVLPQTLFGTWKISANVCLNIKTVLAIMFFMAGLGQLWISPFLYRLKVRIHGDVKFKESQIELPALIGYLETFLYPTALLMGKPLFIAFWLSLKAAGEWPGWKDEKIGRAVHAKFLIGSALMILWGLITYGLIVSPSLR